MRGYPSPLAKGGPRGPPCHRRPVRSATPRPIADKWIREQVEDILGMPEFNREVPGLFEVRSG
jgi:hypothetical protein